MTGKDTPNKPFKEIMEGRQAPPVVPGIEHIIIGDPVINQESLHPPVIVRMTARDPRTGQLVHHTDQETKKDG